MSGIVTAALDPESAATYRLVPGTNSVATLYFPVVSAGFPDRRHARARDDGIADSAECRNRHLDHVPGLERLRRSLTGTAPQLREAPSISQRSGPENVSGPDPRPA